MLSLLASIYGKVANLRNHLYERGILESFDLGARTISVGNLTTGGTGKTPLVAYIAKIFAARGEIVCVLTRGYGRQDPSKRVLVSDGKTVLADAETAGDEPYELAQKLVGKTIVIADADRVAAAEWAKRKFGITRFILDDGFQHRRARRDLDIVCVDATSPFGGSKMLPAGRLREPIENLKRADAIVITRADLAENLSDLRSEISNLRSDIPIFEVKNRIARLVSIDRFLDEKGLANREPSVSEFDTAKFAGQKAMAFCALGNPESFYRLLRRSGFNLAETRSFRDHHKYSQIEISTIEGSAALSGSQFLVTTAKDAVKLSDIKFEIPCYVVEIDMDINDTKGFAAML